ncbi:MAG: RNA polymerase sigma factor [Lachnospiraceae bacterium]
MNIFSGKKNQKNKTLIEEIILKNYNQYYRLAYSYVHNETDAGDIVQNGAYNAIKSSSTLNNPEYAETWVYRIMMNECFRWLKQPQVLSYEKIEEENGIEEVYMDDYSDIDLQRALDTLPARDKAIVVLKYFEDKKLEEIAEILDENVNTVKSSLYRSMKKLYGILSDETNRRKHG